MSSSNFDGAVAAYRQALQELVKGSPTLVAESFSRRDDVTLADPLGRRAPVG